MGEISLDQCLKEAMREQHVRQSLYPNWVQRGQMTPYQATHRLRCQERIVDILAALVATENAQAEAQQDLFPDTAEKI